MKISHIVNPVQVSPRSDLYVAQPVTFRAMRASKQHCHDDLDIELQAVCYEEDAALVPEYFQSGPLLERSVMDVGDFRKRRKLPLIHDILKSAVERSDADYLIYTNVDISPMPFFYSAIGDALQEYDALVINRRTIEKCPTGDRPLAFYYQQVGQSHPGFDCFVFKREHYRQYQLFDACIGANWIGRMLICNLLAYANHPAILTDAHLTFHLGDDRSWKTAENIDFDRHNEAQVGKLMLALHQAGRIDRHQLVTRTYREFYLKTEDPDCTRPSAAPTRETRQVDLSALPTQYLPSNSWADRQGLPLKQDPVFVVGHPRSGTTLLQSLVATQVTPAVFPETHFFSIVRTLIKVQDDRIQTAGFEKVMSFLKSKMQISSAVQEHVTRLLQGQQLSPKMFFEAIVFDQLSQHMNAADIGSSTWMEKTPDHAEHLPVMHRFYPAAKFIFVIRDPEKAILSRRRHFTWNEEASWPIERHAKRWLKTIQSADEFKAHHPDHILYVRFEDVVADKIQQISRICDYLGVDFQPERLSQQASYSRQQCLSWEAWKMNAQSQVSQDIASGNQHRLSSLERSVLDHQLLPYLIEYGYEVTSGVAL